MSDTSPAAQEFQDEVYRRRAEKAKQGRWMKGADAYPAAMRAPPVRIIQDPAPMQPTRSTTAPRPSPMWPFLALLLELAGCGGESGAFPGEAELYAAVLADTTLKVPRTVALDPQLISDSGTYEPSGRLSRRTIAELRRRGLVSEVCGQTRVDDEIRCATRHARGAVQLSRPIRGRGDTVTVFLGRNTVLPAGDTASYPIYMGMQQACRVVRDAAGWKVARCEIVMLT